VQDEVYNNGRSLRLKYKINPLRAEAAAISAAGGEEEEGEEAVWSST